MTALLIVAAATIAGAGAGTAYGLREWRNRSHRGRQSSRAWALAAGVGAVPLMAMDNRIFIPLASFVLTAMMAMIVAIRIKARDEHQESRG
jgi:hypothetical protein